MTRDDDSADYVALARITKAQGRKGEVAAALFTDFPDRFAERKQLFLLSEDGRSRRQVELESFWPHKGGVVLKFAGVDSISQAEELAGCEVQIPRAERVELEEGSVYVSDLVGCSVTDRGRRIGRIEDVQFGAGEAPLLVIKGEKEYLVPFAAEYIERLDPTNKQLDMKLPDGMLDLDEPLNKEEKEQQKRDSAANEHE